MPEIPQRALRPYQNIAIRCPNCGYCPVDLSAEVETRIPQGMNEVELMVMEDELDCFQVLGCDDGNIMCPECACEFVPTIPKPARQVSYEATEFKGGASL